MLFLMAVCRELGMSLAQGMTMSAYELKCWAAFFRMEEAKMKERTRHGGRSIKS